MENAKSGDATGSVSFPLTYLRIFIYSGSLETGLDRCQIYDQGLIDPLLKTTYRKLPRYSTSHHIILFVM